MVSHSQTSLCAAAYQCSDYNISAAVNWSGDIAIGLKQIHKYMYLDSFITFIQMCEILHICLAN